jgi:ATP-binding cassette subfamily B protein
MHPDKPDSWPLSGDAEEPPRQVRRILKLFRPYRGRLAVVGLLVAASSLVSVATPFLLKETLDVAIPEGRTGLLSLLALGMILSAVLAGVFGVLQTLISTTVGQRVMHDLRTAVFGRLQSSRSSRARVPARCSPASPTTSEACRRPSRPPPPPWSPTSPASSPRSSR